MLEEQLATDPATSVPRAQAVAAALIDNVRRVVLGKDESIRLVVAGLLAAGHVLLEDSPGVGKTVLAKSVARSIGGSMGRIQGTADLLPTDITGVTTYDQSTGEWRFRPGPLFHNVVLVDEINRATPRAQSALLEAMAEGHATVDGADHPLPSPFFVLATQNPFGDVGTFSLVEGQLDRFAVAVSLGLPDREAERALLMGDGGTPELDKLEPVVDGADLAGAWVAVDQLVHTSEAVVSYVLDLAATVRARAGTDRGVSPRATLTLLRVAKAHAVVDGRDFVAPDDVKAVAVPALAHRLGALATAGTEGAKALIQAAVASTTVGR
ncbi:MAG: MoxR-like ATPase [Acidimicrobiaceae bacterium]